MDFPDYYLPEWIGELYVPNTSAAIDAGRRADLRPSATDQRKVFLLLVDCQVDFVHPEGALSVPGAVDDVRRTVEWIYKHAGVITTIGASLDSHVPLQIFSPAWWVDEAGHHPSPYTLIYEADVTAGRWRPLYDYDWSIEYVSRLEEASKKVLTIWPYHTLIGTPGHNLVPALYEAIAYHTAARGSQPMFLSKGSLPRTEHYSILEPEVKLTNDPMGGLNHEFMGALSAYDVIYVAGQAKSHCVLETVTSMVRHYPPAVLRNIRVLKDAMSSVVHPDVDFDAIADETFASYEKQGLKLVATTDGIEADERLVD